MHICNYIYIYTCKTCDIHHLCSNFKAYIHMWWMITGPCVLSIFIHTYCIRKSRPRALRRIYEYVPYQMSLKSLRKVDQELQGGYIGIFLTKCLLKA